MREHGHFYCSACETVYDVDLPEDLTCMALPAGFQVGHYEFAIHGVCASCAQKK
jgi:Fe2+ or Zn2+ uptake regulation protein